MRITGLKYQVKNPDRVSVFVDEQFSFGMHVSQILELGIKRGDELSAEDLKRYKKLSDFGRIKSLAIDWLLRRPRSIKETADYLYKKELSSVEINQALLDLDKYLDDRKFAEYWVDQRRDLKKMSARKITAELRSKGVQQEIISECLTDHSIKDVDALTQMIAKKRRIPKFADNQKLTTYLVGQGFSYSEVSAALAE